MCVPLHRHRLSSIIDADNIIVLGQDERGCGQVIEQGTHERLLENGRVYAMLWRNHTGAPDEVERERKTSVEDLFQA